MKEKGRINLAIFLIMSLASIILGGLSQIAKTYPTTTSLAVIMPLTIIVGIGIYGIQLIYMKIVKNMSKGEGGITWDKINPKGKELLILFIFKIITDFVLIRINLKVIEINKIIGWILIPITIFVFVLAYKIMIEKIMKNKIKITTPNYIILTVLSIFILLFQAVYIGFNKMQYVPPIWFDYIYIYVNRMITGFVMVVIILKNYKFEKSKGAFRL